MGEKLVSLLFCSLFVLQNGWFFPVHAGDTEPDYKALPADSQRSPLAGYSVRDKDLIRSYIGDNFVYVYKTPDVPSNAPWIIFKSPNQSNGSGEKYICYQPSITSRVSRSQIIAAIEDFSGCSVCCIDQFLTCRKNVVLEVSF